MRPIVSGARLVTALVAGALCVACLLAGCRQEADEPLPPRSDKHPDQVIAQFHRTETREGRILWELTAARGDVYETDHRVDLFHLNVEYYGREGRVVSRLYADSGRVDTRTQDMEARSNVRVENDRGTVLRSARLDWEEKSGKIRSDEEVEITREGSTLRGRGFEGDPDLETFTLRERVNATVTEQEMRSGDGGRP